jgi:hypothetical protein
MSLFNKQNEISMKKEETQEINITTSTEPQHKDICTNKLPDTNTCHRSPTKAPSRPLMSTIKTYTSSRAFATGKTIPPEQNVPFYTTYSH